MGEVETREEQPEESFEGVGIAEKPKKEWSKIILFSLLGVFALVGAWWLLLVTQKMRKPGVEAPTPTPSVEEQTKSWKTYKSQEYVYEIRYPSSWILRPKEQAPEQIVRFDRSLATADHCEFGIYAGGSSRGLPPGATPSSTRNVSVGGVLAAKETYDDPFNLGTIFWRVIFPEGGTVNQITAQYNKGDTDCMETLDLMLQTFKFTD